MLDLPLNNTDPEAEYRSYEQRLQNLREKLAGLRVEQATKLTRIEELTKQLKAAGVDVTKLPEEEARLQAEIQQVLRDAEQRLDAFQSQLTAVRNTPDTTISIT